MFPDIKRPLLYAPTTILDHPLCTPYQRFAWYFSHKLELAGYITPEKGNYIRTNHLTVAWDPNKRKIIDLLQPDNPRETVVHANWLVKSFSWRTMGRVKQQRIRHTYTGKLPQEILSSPEMAPLLSHFPEIDLGAVTLYVYGKKGCPSFFLDSIDLDILAIAVSPDLFGLPTQLIELFTKVYRLGIYPTKVGSELMGGCLELLAKEGHTCFTGVAMFIEELVQPLGYNPAQLAKEFILGNPTPLFSALEKAKPLASALLTFISDEADDTTTGIDRIRVMRALDL